MSLEQQSTNGKQQSTGTERVLLAAAAGGFVILLVAIGVQHYWLRDLKFDDAMIHFRYSQNIAHGKGFVYNEGERVLGSGGPLWNIVVAGLALFTSREGLLSAVSLLNYLGLLACALVLVLALEKILPLWLTLVITGALLSQGPLLTSSIGGMESVMLCLCYFLCFLTLLNRRFVLSSGWAGVACCFRIESFALVGVCLLATWLYQRRATWRALIAALSLPMILYAWVWAYFGSPIATSTLAKKLVYSLAPLQALSLCLDAVLRVFPFDSAFPWRQWHPETGRMIGLFIWLALIALGYYFLRRKSSPASLIVLHVAAVLGFYAVTNPFMFKWYFCTFVPLATILTMLGMVQLGQFIPRISPSLRYGLFLSILVSFSIVPIRAMWTPFEPPESDNFSFQIPNAKGSVRIYQYANIARWLNNHTKPTDRVCISEIGAFGYYYHGKILDGIGLVSPEVFPYHPLPGKMRRGGLYGAIPPKAVQDLRPEYVVSMDVFAEALFADPWFQQNYDLIGKWPWFGGPVAWRNVPETLWGGRNMLAYRRHDIPWNATKIASR